MRGAPIAKLCTGTKKHRVTHNEFPVLFLESLVALPQLVGHQFVLVSFLLTGIQLLGQNEQGLLLTLQLALTHQELQKCHYARTEQREQRSRHVIHHLWLLLTSSLQVEKHTRAKCLDKIQQKEQSEP